MSEEELNKMAVYLLNCQLRIENRPTFECEESMTIGRRIFGAENKSTIETGSNEPKN